MLDIVICLVLIETVLHGAYCVTKYDEVLSELPNIGFYFNMIIGGLASAYLLTGWSWWVCVLYPITGALWLLLTIGVYFLYDMFGWFKEE